MKRIAVFAALIAVGLAAALWNLRGEPSGPRSDPATGTSPSTAEPRAPTTVTPSQGASPTEQRVPVREPEGNSDLPQGLRGRIVDAAGAPIAGATVDLLEGLAGNPFDALVIAERGVVVPPAARAQSGADGRFRIGARMRPARTFSLRVHAAGYAETVLGEVTLFEDRYSDLGDIKLQRGVRLVGRITVQGAEGFPVPDATVTVRPVGLTPLAAPTADREDGRTVACDAAGRYVFEALPPGMTQVTAVAPGFARVMRPTVDLRLDVDNSCDIELPRGMSIAGTVRDRGGAPLASAAIEARPLVNQQHPRAIARSDTDGRFEVIGLLEGAYALEVVARDHVPLEQKPVRAGARDVIVELAPQPRLSVQVVDPAGASVTPYDLLLLRWRAESDNLSGVPGAQIARVLPVDLDERGCFAAGGADPGSYVLQVEAKGFAKSFSDPFEVRADAQRVDVRVVARRGASLRAEVRDAEGHARSGVRVDTLPEFADDNPLLKMLTGVVPSRASQVHAETGADGRVQLDRLAAGSYRLRFSHPDFCDTWTAELKLDDERSTDLGVVTLRQGTEVVGTATLDGHPAGQIKVSLVAIDADGATLLPQILADAVTDDAGAFRIEKRMPSGRYVARARRETVPTPLLQVLDYEKTKQIVTISEGQPQLRLQFALQSN
ncbi:MAG: carboxypeptidase-like regulatory domain-containing protein [Planctomycetota bacterium]